MIKKIIDGISNALYAEFGDTYKIYTESVEQGLHEPCFSVLCVNPTNELFLGKKYFRQNLFCIQYFPSTNDKFEECMIVLERLFDCLEEIYVENDPNDENAHADQRGTKMHSEMVDGVLNFFVNYDMFVYRVESLENMETYELNQKAEG